MTRPGIEPRSPGPLANTLTAGPMSLLIQYIDKYYKWYTNKKIGIKYYGWDINEKIQRIQYDELSTTTHTFSRKI